MKRKHLSSHKGRKVYNKHAKVLHRKNLVRKPMRGGIRL